MILVNRKSEIPEESPIAWAQQYVIQNITVRMLLDKVTRRALEHHSWNIWGMVQIDLKTMLVLPF